MLSCGLFLAATICLANVRSTSAAPACGGNLTNQGNITSPNYPLTYPISTTCVWTLRAAPGKVILLQFSDFYTENGYDFVRVYNTIGLTYTTPFTRFTGIVSGGLLQGSNVTVAFTSDDTVGYRGFRILFSSVSASATTTTIRPTTAPPPPNCGGILSGSGRILSPNYPAVYPNDAKCVWQLQADRGKVIQLQIVDFKLESLWDVVRVSSPCISATACPLPAATYTGIIASVTAVFANNVTVTFTSDSSVQLTGFNIAFSSVTPPTTPPVASPTSIPAAGSCGVPAVTPKLENLRIIGGSAAQPFSWPWQAMLYYGGYFTCGGALVARQWVLTAAHCVDGKIASRFLISLGKYRANVVDPGEVRLSALIIVKHPNYNSTDQSNDVALIKLQTAVAFSTQISPICLPSAEVAAGTVCYVTGWGVVNVTTSTVASVLMQTSIPIVDRTACANYLEGAFSKSMICAGDILGGKDTCQGDSGGPLVCRVNGTFQLQGVTSWGRGCAAPFSPGVYTRLPGYVNWIQETIVKN